MSTMHHWLLILMIALLPLRGWAAGGMATQMATQKMAVQQASESSQTATELVANYRLLTGTSSTFHHEISTEAAAEVQPDCSGHMSHAHVADSAAPATLAGHSAECGSTCGVCQVCHSVALTLTLPLAIVCTPTQGVASVCLPRFASADRALSLKPPIS